MCLLREFHEWSRRAEIDDDPACRLARFDVNDNRALPRLGQLLVVFGNALLLRLPARHVRVSVCSVPRLQTVAPGGQIFNAERPVDGYQCLARSRIVLSKAITQI